MTTQQIFNKDITAAVSIVAVPFGEIQDATKGASLEAVFDSGSGGTSVKAYVQTSFDNTNWTDIACFAFTTSDARRLYNLRAETPVTSIATPTDGALTDNTSVDGLIGKYIRTKYVTVGTYTGANLIINAKFTA